MCLINLSDLTGGLVQGGVAWLPCLERLGVAGSVAGGGCFRFPRSRCKCPGRRQLALFCRTRRTIHTVSGLVSRRLSVGFEMRIPVGVVYVRMEPGALGGLRAACPEKGAAEVVNPENAICD